VKWPQAYKEMVLLQFDKDAILEAMAKGEADRRFQSMTTSIVSLAAERFGLEERSAAKHPFTTEQQRSTSSGRS